MERSAFGITSALVILNVVLALVIVRIISLSSGKRVSFLNSKFISVITDPSMNLITVSLKKDGNSFLKIGTNSFLTLSSRFL